MGQGWGGHDAPLADGVGALVHVEGGADAVPHAVATV